MALHRDLADDSDEPPALDDALAACVQLGLSGPGESVATASPANVAVTKLPPG